jgi:hypothetical protein
MVETITPVVHGGRARWIRAVALHVLGAAVTAALFGAALGATGSLLGAPWGPAGAIAVAVVALAYAVDEVPGVWLPVPQLKRQVPDWWRTFFGPSVASFLYGAGLGVGFLTFLAHGTLVAVGAAAIAIGDPVRGALILGAFGVARGVAILVSGSITSVEEGAALLDRLVARSDVLRRLGNGLALAALAAVSLWVAVRSPGGWGTDGWALFSGALVAGAFAWSGVAKIASPRRWRRALEGRALPPRVAHVASRAVPMVELVVPMLALLGLRRASAAVALVLLAVFSADIVRVRLMVGAEAPCGCFGGRRTVPAWRQLARNATLAILAGFTIAAAPDAPALRWPGAPGSDDLVPAVLATVGVVVAVFAAWRATWWLTRGREA